MKSYSKSNTIYDWKEESKFKNAIQSFIGRVCDITEVTHHSKRRVYVQRVSRFNNQGSCITVFLEEGYIHIVTAWDILSIETIPVTEEILYKLEHDL